MPADETTWPADGTGLIALDPWLKPYADRLRHRFQHYQQLRERIVTAAGSLEQFSRQHEYLGLNHGQREGQAGVWYREWAPGAQALFLTGDFNGWDRASHPLQRDDAGVWSLFLPDSEYRDRLVHGGRVKVHVHSAIGPRDRIPAYIRRAVYDPHSHDFCGQYWHPAEPYAWQHSAPALQAGLRIYEAHVGMALEAERIGTYREFTELVLPRIVAAGYNAIQLMAIQEHPYYASFGYHVSSFFAASSRFGTPRTSRPWSMRPRRGLLVLLDAFHSTPYAI
jgi:1,4-alpha-glucan branching enzyme